MIKLIKLIYRRLFHPSGVITGDRLKKLVAEGIILGIAENAVKGSTVDVRLCNIIKPEKRIVLEQGEPYPIVIPGKTKLPVDEWDLNVEPYAIKPGQFVISGLLETFNLPPTISAKFYLSSTFARCGTEHSSAIYLKPAHKGVLALEIFNVAQYHSIRLETGMDIGCIEFIEHDECQPYVGKYQDVHEIVN